MAHLQPASPGAAGLAPPLTLMTLPPELLELIALHCACVTPPPKSEPAAAVGDAAPASEAPGEGEAAAPATARAESPSSSSSVASGEASAAASGSSSSYRSEAAPPLPRAADYSAAPPAEATPPSAVRALLMTCRRAHALLNTEANPRLYARIFRTKFDVAAIARRFGPQAVSSRSLCLELQRRCKALKRIRGTVDAGRLRNDSQAVLEENLWLAYLMLLENDGLNLQQLKWAHIDGYLQLHHTQEMLQSAIQAGYPPETPDRALALHLSYLLTDPAELATEPRDVSDEKLFVLRPFVFAAHKFDAYFGPWVVRQLPLRSDEESEPGPRAAPNNPFLADLRPRARATTITHCGQQLAVAPPILSHAACFSFFAKVERDPAVIGLTALQEGEPGPARDDVGRANSNPLLLRSEDHDKDLTRLFACADPRRSLGLKPLFHAGDFEGAWEGRFCFFDFDSYREMLAGRMRSLYEGPFGEQPQVWKVREHIVRVGNGGSMQEGGTGSILNAGYVNGAEEPDQLGDGAYVSPEKVAAARDEAASGSNVEGLRDDKGKKSLNAAVYEGWAKDGRPRDWHLYPSFGDDEEKEASDDPERYEILLSGTGHSAWGRFVLRGRVRSWDGMMIMTKEYRPDGRGRWLYRGYAVAGGRLVGRWRDTFTPDDMSGYEGCFLLSRRDAS
ncbi:hypothetical protein FA09DRAFT_342096 [Tilletiopsis washingtonensis]|uniref:F-box domain-containing protein n=1 Tax=Tilletiopsis washingtonensis TaxID=58919 RepID=A0A316ZJN7_9BASI|nr:hypothetical protein FA09DRAFT_342096 [Tilletiopsis washingtonensis]PWO01213.1 hypothetical protein FA09DRAFT_342096 [Tilletiopsis washingtonensis]